MSTRWQQTQFSKFIKLRKAFITIRDDQEYLRVTVQLYARGIKKRDTIFGSQLKTKKQQVIRAGDLLVAEIDAKVGGFGIVPPELAGAIVSSHYYIYEIDPDFIDTAYLKYYLRSGKPTEEVQQYVKGSTNYASIRSYHFPELTIPLPALTEQQQIVAILDAFTNRTSKAQGYLRQVKAQTQALRVSSLAKLTQLCATKFPNKALEEVTEIVGGGTPSKKNALYWQGDIPWVTPKDMKSFIIDNSQQKITQLGLQESSAKLIRPEAVLVVFRSSILARTIPVAVNTVPLTINQDIKAFLPNEELLPSYLAMILAGKEKEILGLVKQGATVHSLRTSSFKKILVPIPPLEFQKKVVKWELKWRERYIHLLNEINSLYEMLSSLVPALLRQAYAGNLQAFVPQSVIQNMQAQSVTTASLQLNTSPTSPLLRTSAHASEKQTPMEKIVIESSTDLTRLLQYLAGKGHTSRKVTATELWTSSQLGNTDLFYAYLKSEHEAGRIIEQRNGYKVYLELGHESEQTLG